MKDFPRIPATLKSINRRKPVCGVGINDADYIVKPTIDGRRLRCPYYTIWESMLSRCYDPRQIARFPTYSDCSVSAEWLIFSGFRAWAEKQDWEGKHLDKDILLSGNKIYSPKTCVFVSPRVNSFMIDRNAKRGDWPIGVCFCGGRNKYKAQIGKASGKSIHLGYFDSPEQAHDAWRKAKSGLALEIAEEQDDCRVRRALISFSVRLTGGH